VADLAIKLGVTPAAVIKELIGAGVFATMNQSVDYDTAAGIAEKLGIEVQAQAAPVEAERAEVAPAAEDKGKLVNRPPVVTIMGHVDHGKTSLLDAIRSANVAAGEAGGITQHIGAYQVEIRGEKITFLDTPGHEAFTAMRARGAQATDIAILVVAADDGVQPQTKEAIDHARAAKVPIIIAINKIDKIDAQPDRVKQQLADYGLIVEDWGGEVVSVPVSARRKEGIEQLLEMILLVSEIADLKANPSRTAQGVVIEAKLDKARGPIATLLVQNGTLRLGENIVVGGTAGKVRAMQNEAGKRMSKAPPSMPVEVLGLTDVVHAGETFRVAPDEKTARIWAQEAATKLSEESTGVGSSLESISLAIQSGAGAIKDLNLILKTDVNGSIEPIRESLEKISTDEVHVRVIHTGTGNITENDVLLARASGGIIAGFNVKEEVGATRAAEAAGVSIRLYSVIYDILDDIQKALTGMLEPKFVEVVEGHAEVRQTFKVGKVAVIAGCIVTDGRIGRTSTVRIIRGGKSIFEGKINSLRRFKDDVREVLQGYECGIGVEGFNDITEGDVIEASHTEKES
jgi:translation initiation factor IF-2